MPTWVCDPDTQAILDVNAAAERQYGYARRDFLRMRITEIAHKDDVSALLVGLSAARRGAVFSTECRQSTRDAEQLAAKVLIRPVEFGGRPACSVVARMFPDASSDRDFFVTQSQILPAIVDHIPAMITLVDDQIRLHAVNHEWERVFGWSQDEVLGRNDILEDVLPDPEERQRAIEFVQRADGSLDEFRLVVNGRFLHQVWSSIRLSDGKIVGLGLDITQRKIAEDAWLVDRERLESSVEAHWPAGSPYGLTFRELTVLALVARGLANRDIAHRLGISVRTVDKHLESILHKMGAASRTEAGVRAVQEGITNGTQSDGEPNDRA